MLESLNRNQYLRILLKIWFWMLRMRLLEGKMYQSKDNANSEVPGATVTDAEIKAKLAEECCAEHNRGIINGAPLLIATLIVDKRSGFERDGSYSTSRKDCWQAFDNGIATQTLCLAANDKGLGTVIMGLYDIDKAEEIIGVPEGQLLMALVAVGYPDEEPGVPKKKTVDDLLSYR